MEAAREKYIFDVPVYWCKESSFWRDYDARLAAHLAEFERQTGYPLADSLRDSLTEDYWRSYIAPWKFNQIVGWVRIYKLGNQLRGELWYMNARRATTKLTKKQFSDKGKAFELFMPKGASSKDICEGLRRELVLVSLESKNGRKAILDLETFDNLSPHVDWRALLDTNA